MKVRDAILANGRTLTDAAALIGCGVSTLGNYLNGKTEAGSDLLKKVAVFLKRSPDEIPRRGDLEFIRAVGMSAYIMGDADVRGDEASPHEAALRKVPVVSFARAGQNGFDYEDLGSHFDEWVPTTIADPNAFALRVEGDSMETKYSPGDVLVVAPNEQPRNGDLVVARLERSGGVLFKLYHEVGADRIRLTSYNKDLYPPLEYPRGEFRFIYPILNVLSNPRGR